MQLRPYQQAAVDAVYNHLRDGSIRDNVELTSIDEEVVKAWEQYTRACGLTLSVNIDDKCPTYTAVCSRGRDHLLTESLAALFHAELPERCLRFEDKKKMY